MTRKGIEVETQNDKGNIAILKVDKDVFYSSKARLARYNISKMS